MIKEKKYAVQVYMVATATKCAGVVYCDNENEYTEIVDKNSNELFESGDFSINCHNDFDLGDADIEEVDFKYAEQHLLNDRGNK